MKEWKTGPVVLRYTDTGLMYVCEECDKTYVYEMSYIKHMHEEHDYTPQNIKGRVDWCMSEWADWNKQPREDTDKEPEQEEQPEPQPEQEDTKYRPKVLLHEDQRDPKVTLIDLVEYPGTVYIIETRGQTRSGIIWDDDED